MRTWSTQYSKAGSTMEDVSVKCPNMAWATTETQPNRAFISKVITCSEVYQYGV